jgi:dihydroxy-acid dehydratase
VRDGDTIAVDIPARTIEVRVGEGELEARRGEELARGKAAFRPRRDRKVSEALRAYALFAASADQGAVRVLPGEDGD